MRKLNQTEINKLKMLFAPCEENDKAVDKLFNFLNNKSEIEKISWRIYFPRKEKEIRLLFSRHTNLKEDNFYIVWTRFLKTYDTDGTFILSKSRLNNESELFTCFDFWKKSIFGCNDKVSNLIIEELSSDHFKNEVIKIVP